jgi:competence protein ComEC
MKDYPVIKFAILFLFGIIIQHYFGLPIIIFPAALTIFILFYLLLKNFQAKFKKNVFTQILLCLVIISFGSFVYLVQKPSYNFISPEVYKERHFSAYGEITSIDLIRDNEVVFYVKTDSISAANSVIPVKVNLLCRIKYNHSELQSIYSKILPGNKISLEGTYEKGRGMRNPGEFNYDKYLRSKGISGILTSYESSQFKILNNHSEYLESLIFKVRKSIDYEIYKLHDPVTASLLRGLILADRSEIDYSIKNEFINSGVVHVLAVSGLHVGFIALIFYIIFGRFNLYLRSGLTITGLLCFLVITGIHASVFRAVIMSIVIITAYVTNRSTNLNNSLALAAVIILLFFPQDLFTPGFQLSFAAVLSISLLYPFFKRELEKLNIRHRFVYNIFLFMGLSLSAQIGTLPFILAYFGKLSLVAVFANLVVIPLIGAIVGIAVFTLFLSPIIPFAAQCLAETNNLLTGFLYRFVHFTGSLNFSFVWIRQFNILDSIIFYAIAIFSIYFYKRFEHISAKIFLLLLTFLNIAFFTSTDNINLLPKGKLSLMMIDVGQGDAFLMKFPNGKTALIDAGSATYYFDNGEETILPLMNYLDVHKIDYGFVSHIDLDHYGGFISLIHDGKIKQIFKPSIDSSLSKDKRFEAYLHKNKIPIKHYHKEILKIGSVRIYVMNPSPKSKQKDVMKFYHNITTNNSSGMFKVVYGKTSILFTGDMEKKAEYYYSSHYKNFLDVNVLKVAHHGSKTSSTLKFLSYSEPEISLISDGIKNRFKQPSQIVLDRLRQIHSKIFRTDKIGAVLLQSNGDSVYVVNWRKEL